jgi:hypothetical protein
LFAEKIKKKHLTFHGTKLFTYQHVQLLRNGYDSAQKYVCQFVEREFCFNLFTQREKLPTFRGFNWKKLIFFMRGTPKNEFTFCCFFRVCFWVAFKIKKKLFVHFFGAIFEHQMLFILETKSFAQQQG